MGGMYERALAISLISSKTMWLVRADGRKVIRKRMRRIILDFLLFLAGRYLDKIP